jgi:hypothetical protein
MALTKISRGLLSTGVSDSSDATAITIDSNEDVTVNNGTLTSSGANGVGNQGFHITDTGYSKTHKLFGDNSLHIQADSGQSILMKPNASEIARFTSDGLTFNGDTAAANALDDYEEGTWTATLSSSGGGFAASATSFSGGQYNKIGNMVTAHIYTGSFDITNAGSGYAKVSGLPYTSRAGTYDYGSVIFYHTNCFANPSPTGYVAGGADFTIASRGDQAAVGGQLWKTGTTLYLMLQVQYQAA